MQVATERAEQLIDQFTDNKAERERILFYLDEWPMDTDVLEPADIEIGERYAAWLRAQGIAAFEEVATSRSP